MPDVSLLYTPPRPGALDELQAMLPEIEVSTGKRKIKLRWRTTKALKAFLAEILADEDLIPVVATWHRDWSYTVDGGVGTTVGFNLSAAEVDVLLRQLRRLRQGAAAE